MQNCLIARPSVSRRFQAARAFASDMAVISRSQLARLLDLHMTLNVV